MNAKNSTTQGPAENDLAGHATLPASDSLSESLEMHAVIASDSENSEHSLGKQGANGRSPGVSEISDSLAKEAKSYGISDDEMQDYTSHSLQQYMAAVDRQVLAALSAQQQGQAGMSAAPTGQQPPPPNQFQQAPWATWQHQPPLQQGFYGSPPAVPPQMQPSPPWLQGQNSQPPSFFGQAPAGVPGYFAPPAGVPGYFAQPAQAPQSFPEFNEEEIGEDLSKVLKGMHSYYQSQLQSMNSSLQQQKNVYDNWIGHLQQQQEAQYTAWFDEKVDSLGDDFTTVFGRGPGTGLANNSSELHNRLKLSETINRLGQVYPQASDDELFARAIRAEYGAAQLNIQRQQLSNQLKTRSRKTIGRPGRNVERPDAQINPELGMPQGIVDKVQREIDLLMDKRR